MDTQIIERLCKLRKEHGYSQEQLADELGVSRQAVSKWERGEASPDTENLIALAKLYNMSLDDLLFEKQADKQTEQTKETVEIVHNSRLGAIEGVVSGVTVMLCCIVYFLLGGIWGLWHPAWIIFLAIPIVPTIPTAISKRDMNIFCFPVLVVAVYLLLGCQWGLWNPWWVIFFLIPIYYIIADFLRKIKHKS